MNIQRLTRFAIVGSVSLTLAAGLAACGGGGDDALPPAADTEVPASATASPEAYSRYAGSLRADDHADPLSVDKVVPPVSETATPIEAG
jgi:hypothetical protein